ncbi:MAG: pyruvate formate lyase family protein [Hydrogeniiclostridium mannosilyticum]
MGGVGWLFLPDFEAFYHLLEKYLKEDLSVAIQLSYERDRECAKDPEILGSVFTDGCIERAVPASQGGARYNFCTWCLIGLVNLANSLSVIRQMVFDEKKFSLLELRGFIRDNWEGHDDVLVDIRKHAHFLGSNDPLGDDLVNRIARSVVEMTRMQRPIAGAAISSER